MAEQGQERLQGSNCDCEALFLGVKLPCPVHGEVGKAEWERLRDRERALVEALTQLIYAIDLPSELGKIESYRYNRKALLRLHGALHYARQTLALSPPSEGEPDYEHMEESRHDPPVGEEWEDTKGRTP